MIRRHVIADGRRTWSGDGRQSLSPSLDRRARRLALQAARHASGTGRARE